jgi:hypothetical protein
MHCGLLIIGVIVGAHASGADSFVLNDFGIASDRSQILHSLASTSLRRFVAREGILKAVSMWHHVATTAAATKIFSEGKPC